MCHLPLPYIFVALGRNFATCFIVYFTDRTNIALFALFCPKFLYLKIGKCYRLEIFTKVWNWYYKVACKISRRSDWWLPLKKRFWVKNGPVCKIRTNQPTNLKFYTSSSITFIRLWWKFQVKSYSSAFVPVGEGRALCIKVTWPNFSRQLQL